MEDEVESLKGVANKIKGSDLENELPFSLPCLTQECLLPFTSRLGVVKFGITML